MVDSMEIFIIVLVLWISLILTPRLGIYLVDKFMDRYKDKK